MRRVLIGTALFIATAVALVLNVGAFLLSPVSIDAEAAGSQLTPGPLAVGVEQLSLAGVPDVQVWYPAEGKDRTEGQIGYGYELRMFDPVGAVWLGSNRGSAARGAPAASTGPFPLVVLEPGFAVGSSSYAWLAEHVTSHGYVVVTLVHAEDLDPRDLGEVAVLRPAAVSAVLDGLGKLTISEPRWGRTLDMGRVAVVGHSIGGFSALALAGARIDSAAFEQRCEGAVDSGEVGEWLCDSLVPQLGEMANALGLEDVPDAGWPDLRDDRVDAVVSFAGDAYLFGAPGLRAIDVPTLAIGGTADADSPFEWTTRLVADNVRTPMSEAVALEGAGHMVFTNPCATTRRVLTLVGSELCFEAGSPREEHHTVIADATLAFLERTLGQVSGSSARG
jgi:predicted dienelactone hydrolase